MQDLVGKVGEAQRNLNSSESLVQSLGSQIEQLIAEKNALEGQMAAQRAKMNDLAGKISSAQSDIDRKMRIKRNQRTFWGKS